MALIASGATAWTYQDCIEHLLDSHDTDRTGKNQRDARRAVMTAYRELPQKHTWSYFQRQRLLQTVASYSTGTIAFDLTGGAHELMLTLTTGTWPSWAAMGRVIIADVHYEVNRRISDSIITLNSNSAPAADVASGTTYTIYKNSYLLPNDFRRLLRLWDTTNNREIIQTNADRQHAIQQAWNDQPGDPWECTVRGTSDYYGAKVLILGPPPSTAITCDLYYDSLPQALTVDSYSTGSVSVSSATVTLTGGAFPASCVGCIMRFSNTLSPPTGPYGNLKGSDNIFAEQGVIKSRTSATEVVLEEAPTGTYSGVGYTVSSPIDLDQGAMFTAFLRMAEAEYMRIANRGNPNGWQAMLPAVDKAIRTAMENDAALGHVGSRLFRNPYRNVSYENG